MVGTDDDTSFGVLCALKFLSSPPTLDNAYAQRSQHLRADTRDTASPSVLVSAGTTVRQNAPNSPGAVHNSAHSPGASSPGARGLAAAALAPASVGSGGAGGHVSGARGGDGGGRGQSDTRQGPRASGVREQGFPELLEKLDMLDQRMREAQQQQEIVAGWMQQLRQDRAEYRAKEEARDKERDEAMAAHRQQMRTLQELITFFLSQQRPQPHVNVPPPQQHLQPGSAGSATPASGHTSVKNSATTVSSSYAGAGTRGTCEDASLSAPSPAREHILFPENTFYDKKSYEDASPLAPRATLGVSHGHGGGERASERGTLSVFLPAARRSSPTRYLYTHPLTRTHACTHVRTHACTHARMHACTHTHAHTHTHVCVCVCVCMCVCVCVCMCVCMYVCMYVCIYV